MEDRHQLKRARTTHSVIQDAPLEKYDHHHKRAMVFAGVAMSMLIIVGLYAASFRYRRFAPEDTEGLSRWGVLQEEFTDDSKSVVDGFRDIAGTVTGVLNANKVRAESIAIMKEKLVASASGTDMTGSASSTPPDEDMTEHAPTEN